MIVKLSCSQLKLQVMMGSPQQLCDCHMAMENQLSTTANIPEKQEPVTPSAPNSGGSGSP